MFESLLIDDDRVLYNILTRGITEPVDYFERKIQTAVKPHMRRIVTEWMLEVSSRVCKHDVNICLHVITLLTGHRRAEMSRGSLQFSSQLHGQSSGKARNQEITVPTFGCCLHFPSIKIQGIESPLCRETCHLL